MSAKHTPNYALSQWEASDPVVRVDFNADNAKIDAALAQKADVSALAEKADKSALSSLATKTEVSTVQSTVPKIAAGSYTGDGNRSRTVSLGFTPKLVYVCASTGEVIREGSGSLKYCYGGLAVTGHPAACKGGNLVVIQSGGFQVFLNPDAPDSAYPYSNASNTTYHYFAIG